MKIITCDQGTPEWLAARAGIPTASRFADLMATIKSGEAASRRNYRTDLVVERLTGKPLDNFQTAAMKQGIEREPLGKVAYETHTGHVLQPIGFIRHDSIPAGASPDALIGDDGGFELKCPERSAHLEYLLLDKEPPAYRWQIQGGMWITGRAWWDFASWNPDFPEHLQLVVRRVQRDEKAIEQLAAAVMAFTQEVDAELERVRAIPLAA